ncbi:MAG: type II toxin-antitoxin system RelB/DinJ family antitoxin [Mailhella sp.]
MPEPLYIDTELAARAEKLFRELGLDLPTAIRLFLMQSLREQALPFPLRLTSSASPAAAPFQENDTSSENSPVKADSPGSQEEASADLQSAFSENSQTEELFSKSPKEESISEEKTPSSDTAYASKKTADSSREVFSMGPVEAAHAALNEGRAGELRHAFSAAKLIGARILRIRSLNRLYSIGEPNAHVQGWREVYVSGDEPFALDFGSIRLELGCHGGVNLRMMDGRLPDSVLEADAVYPRDLSAVFSSVIGQKLIDVSSSRIWHEGHEGEQLNLFFSNNCTLSFASAGDWGSLWLTDAQGAVKFAPDAVWRRVLGDRTWNALQ